MYTVGHHPHIRSSLSTRKIMWLVILALLPSGIGGFFIFGSRVLSVVAASVISALLTEALIFKLRGKKIPISDGSTILTGLLLAYNLPATVPLWIPAVGSFFAVAIVKHAFGGLGHNIFNPALAGRVFLQISWPLHLSRYPSPGAIDAVTKATPLTRLAEHGISAELPSYGQLFLGERGGCLGEVCIIALLIGAAFLLIKRIISWQIPLSFIGAVALMSWAFGGESAFSGDAVFHILAGGVILGAFFMATDYVTSPLSAKGHLIFGAGCGFVTMVIRLWGGFPEGVSYAILLMGCAVPMIDRYTKPRVYGT